MVKINYAVLEMDHIVEFTEDNTVFACARENDSGLMRLFLVNGVSGNVYARNGRIDSWEELFGSERRGVIARIVAARNNQIPIYRINGNQSIN